MSDNPKISLSKEQQAKAIAWLEQHWKKENRTCEVCLSANWLVLENIISPMIFSAGAFFVGNAYPQFMVMCKNCGNTKYFNALLSGVISQIEKKE